MLTKYSENYYPMIFKSDIYLGEYFFSNEKNIIEEGFYDYKNSKIKGDYKLNRKKIFLCGWIRNLSIWFFRIKFYLYF